jgi:uncharacterized protein YbaA (DUF1428 family)
MIKAKYVDGFLIAIPKKNTAAYKKMAQEAKKVWLKFGALDYKECMMEDPNPQHVTLTFPKLTNIKPTETVWFSYIGFKSRKHRDAVNAKVMSYFEKKYSKENMQMPFDMKRFSYGGFEVMVG